MGGSPTYSLLAVFFFLVIGSSGWRRSRIRRARRDLPTAMQRRLGPDPMFDPRADPPEGLRAYTALHRRTARIQYAAWALGFAWLVWVAYLLVSAAPAGATEADDVFLLFRTSLVETADREHVATFDTRFGLDYNFQNCWQAAELFQSQEGVSTRFWCEPVTQNIKKDTP
ncbi:hypothetical protein [Citreimonas salinaria]|uniref:Uncharacterized protein n=1 Tax=Citreimonas salinaria TaxID=321339 RepID=A0A1H3HTF9_9RHOB|nr:hypothetical protein [Citreimonas salinaria]SDY18811.1 hypothetical protein SAMN05444340_104159 [Citreimonas salinaria]